MRCFNAEHFVQFRACCRVLQENAFFRIHVFGSSESSQRAFMETGQDQFLFARINVDIADGKNARDVGFEAGSVHNDLFSFERQAPIRNRSEY